MLLNQVMTLTNKIMQASLFDSKSWIAAHRGVIIILAELTIVAAWVLLFTSPYLDMDPNMVPAGREYLSAIQTHTVWENAKSCGLCALWYGGVGGGFPALADPVASTLHPIVVVTTLVWGVVNGSKVALVAIFAIAGLGQWLLGYRLGLRPVARVWAAGMAVVAGYLAARLDQGAFSLILSTASAVLVFPALVALARSEKLRHVVWLAIVLAMVAVGGTGYVQIALVFIVPTAFLLVPLRRKELAQLARLMALSIGLALLLAGPVMVPFVHFMPEIAKDLDVAFQTAQPFAYVPLNLVISDTDFFLTDTLGKVPWPAHYANFLGWLPIVLAAWGFSRARSAEERRAVMFLGSAAIMALWIASAAPLAWIVKTIEIDLIVQLLAGIRFTPFIAGLAIPPLLGLAAIGLDQLLDTLRRPVSISIEGDNSTSSRVSLDLRWLLVIPLFIALNQARNFTGQWIKVVELDPFVANVIETLQTPNLEWVNVPLGEHYFVTPAVEQGLKLSEDFFRTWHWKDRPVPAPLLEASRHESPIGMIEQDIVNAIRIHRAIEEPSYAQVLHPDESRTTCAAQGTGGDIDVTCTTEQPGNLLVAENSWSGWKVLIDGQPAELIKENWLSVEAPAGMHTYSFRYRPTDAFLGFGLLTFGLVISGWFVLRD